MEHGPAHVLLIEDNPGDADLVRLRLVESKSDVFVNCVPRLSDALACLDAETPSLVLLDLNLPDSHGAETFRRIMQKAPNVPVVILSGQDDEALAIKAVHQGVQDYLVKGDITGKQLERALRYAVERQGLLRSLEITRKQQLEFKNQFLSHVSHELRTPLTCIHQYVTILLYGLAVAVLPGIGETETTSVSLSVSDTGRGIPQDSLPRVFERLYQDPDSVDDSRAGLGLGLFIAKEIVTLQGGRMWVASQPGSGSTFSFTLPLYSLAKLLLPVITYQGHLRASLVMVRVELTPLSKSLRGNWRETCEQCLERLRLFIYGGEDLGLPVTGTSGPVEPFFVVASTDMERVSILMDRIRDQIGAIPRLKAGGTLRVTAEKIPDPPAADAR